MPVYKFTSVMQLTTAPTNLTRAIPHTGGWTESVWASTNAPAQIAAWLQLQLARRNILPKQATIVGYRVQGYNIAGNRLIPLGTSAVAQNLPGNASFDTDLPQVSVDIKIANAAVSNSARYVLRGMPDSVMVFGEYQPNAAMATRMTQFMNQLTNGFWVIVGRDRTQPTQRVVKILGDQLTLDGVLVGAAENTFIRLLRVYSDSGFPIKGVFRVAAPPVGAVYTLSPSPGLNLGHASGLARIDAIAVSAISQAEVSRARVRKIGRPSQGYRGRRSKTRV